jgi:hypothetical protein
MVCHEKPSIESVIAQFGLRPRMGFIRCPVHEEDTPSCKLHEDWWICFGCGATGDSIGLIAALTKRPVADVLRQYAEKVPTWRRNHTVSLPPRGTTVRKAYRELHDWFFHQLATRLNGAPDWMLERAITLWCDPFDEIALAIRDDEMPKAEGLLKALSAQLERALDVEGKLYWEWLEGQLVLRQGVDNG